MERIITESILEHVNSNSLQCSQQDHPLPQTVTVYTICHKDDTNIHAALYDTHNSCTTSLQEDLDRLQNWTVDMQMRFHPAKCRTMHLGKHNLNIKYTLPIDDGTLHKIVHTAEEKDLGHTFRHLDKESFLYLYKILVHPYLEYASVIWSPKMKKHQDSIEKVQRRATRLLPEISHLSYRQTINPWSTLFKVQMGKN